MIPQPRSDFEEVSDRCPFTRPFAADFDGWPAFSARDFTALDLRYKPLRTVVSCRHLVSGRLPLGGYYARCALGDAVARQQWVAQVGSGRLERIRAVGADYRSWAAARMPELWALKGTWLELQALGDETGSADAARELRAGLDKLVADANAWVDQRADQLAEADLPPEALKELIAKATADWAKSTSQTSGYQIPDELLGRFPTAVQVFFTASRT